MEDDDEMFELETYTMGTPGCTIWSVIANLLDLGCRVAADFSAFLSNMRIDASAAHERRLKRRVFTESIRDDIASL